MELIYLLLIVYGVFALAGWMFCILAGEGDYWYTKMWACTGMAGLLLGCIGFVYWT